MTTRTLAPLVAVALCAALLGGCGGDEPDPGTGNEPTYDAIGPSDDATSTEADDPTPSGPQGLCAAFTDAFEAFAATGAQDFPQGDDPVPAGLRDALQDWGQDLADAELPGDLTDDQSAGIAVMSRLLLAIPDDATGRDLEALEDDLSASEDRQVEAAGDYVEESCDSSFF